MSAFMNLAERMRSVGRVFFPVLVLCLAAAAATVQTLRASSDAPAQRTTLQQQQEGIPAGTILPVVLRTTLSTGKAKQGERIQGELAQDVPLPGGSKLRKGTKVEGEVVEVVKAANGPSGKIALRFDKLILRGRPTTIATDLRAIAGFMTVREASEPDLGNGESEVAQWLPTTQIGGDTVYGVGGTVNSAHDAGLVVGKSLMSGGVLVEVSANAAGGCRGALENNNSPQALWVFSSDACGVYGKSKVRIAHAGRSEPIGTIVLEVQDDRTELRNGDGLLLRVLG
jgi:hypothetical protein